MPGILGNNLRVLIGHKPAVSHMPVYKQQRIGGDKNILINKSIFNKQINTYAGQKQYEYN